METTFLPTTDDIQFAENFLKLQQTKSMPQVPKLISSDGSAIELTPVLERVIRLISQDWASHRAISVVSHESKMTTQQAADFMGISRPTLIKYLEEFSVPVTMIGRHRKVAFADLQELQKKVRAKRTQAVREMRRIAEAAGEYDFDYSDNPLIRG
jgi:excisionase family DNA binding protein